MRVRIQLTAYLIPIKSTTRRYEDFKAIGVTSITALVLAVVGTTTVSVQHVYAFSLPPVNLLKPEEPPDVFVTHSMADEQKLIVNKAILLFGVNLPPGHESPTFIQNVTQLAKEGFDSPENAKLFLQLDSIALNSTSSRPGNVTFTTPVINHIISVYNQ